MICARMADEAMAGAAPAAGEEAWEELFPGEAEILHVEEGAGPMAESTHDVEFSVQCVFRELQEPMALEGAEAVRERATEAQGEELQPGALLEDSPRLRVRIGEGDTCPALELALRFSRRGARFRVRSGYKMAFGPEGRPVHVSETVRAVPPYAAVEFQVTVFSVTPPDLEMARAQDVLAFGSFRKEVGNRMFAAQQYMHAARCYSKALQKMNMANVTEDDRCFEQTVDVWVDLNNNLAACHQKMGDPRKAKEACIAALEAKPGHLKTLYRAARACMALSEYDEADAVIKRAEELQPESNGIRRLRREFDHAQAQYRKRSKRLYSEMGKRLFPDANKPEGSAAPAPAAAPAAAPASAAPTAPNTEHQQQMEEEDEAVDLPRVELLPDPDDVEALEVEEASSSSAAATSAVTLQNLSTTSSSATGAGGPRKRVNNKTKKKNKAGRQKDRSGKRDAADGAISHAKKEEAEDGSAPGQIGEEEKPPPLTWAFLWDVFKQELIRSLPMMVMVLVFVFLARMGWLEWMGLSLIVPLPEDVDKATAADDAGTTAEAPLEPQQSPMLSEEELGDW